MKILEGILNLLKKILGIKSPSKGEIKWVLSNSLKKFWVVSYYLSKKSSWLSAMKLMNQTKNYITFRIEDVILNGWRLFFSI